MRSSKRCSGSVGEHYEADGLKFEEDFREEWGMNSTDFPPGLREDLLRLSRNDRASLIELILDEIEQDSLEAISDSNAPEVSPNFSGGACSGLFVHTRASPQHHSRESHRVNRVEKKRSSGTISPRRGRKLVGLRIAN